MHGSDHLDLVRYAVAREIFREVAGILGAAGIPTLPLKGVWLQAYVYAEPWQRPTTDVDVLVPEARFERALTVLHAKGWRATGGNASEVCLRHASRALPIDLHRRLFLPGAFALSTADIFGRARRAAAYPGGRVWLPDPRDAFAHLVGHFVKSRGDAEDLVHLRDFSEVGRALSLDARACAAHLHATGLARAARYALACALEHRSDDFLEQVLRALPFDPVGSAFARVGRTLASRFPRSSPLRAAPGYLLERNLGAGARLAYAVARTRLASTKR